MPLRCLKLERTGNNVKKGYDTPHTKSSICKTKTKQTWDGVFRDWFPASGVEIFYPVNLGQQMYQPGTNCNRDVSMVFEKKDRY